ncbi:MAG: heparinase II/III family protein, partial [Armatimonadetes bacterium]|nr:heparinase II/III family protein [Armatimonadota bacterium]
KRPTTAPSTRPETGHRVHEIADCGTQRVPGIADWRSAAFNPKSEIRNPKQTVEPSQSSLLDGKGLAILRSGTGAEGRAAFVRYGPSVCHGHRDDLNLNFYALGRELTYDLGYSLGSAHVQTGWAHQTGCHNLVMVNEKNQLESGPSGGSATLFAASDQIEMAEMSCDHSYQSEGVDLYRRTIALVDVGPKDSYLVDIFRVHGGNTHDLLWHALGDQTSVEGATLGEVEKGSLARSEYEWGTKIGPDGDINLITAKGPGILQRLPHADFAILRRKGADLDSTFTSLLQPYAKTNPVRHIEGMRADNSAGSPVGIKISVGDDRTDYIFSALKSDTLHDFSSKGEAASFRGRFAFCRFGSNGIEDAVVTGASRVSVRDFSVDCGRSSYWGEIISVDYDKCSAVVNRRLPTGDSLVGTGIYISRPGYGHSSYYKIRSVRSEKGRTILGLETGTLVLGPGCVGKQAEPGSREIDNLVPLEMCRSCQALDTGYFNGKLLVAEDGTRSAIENVRAADGKRIIQVPDASRFKSGQRLTIYDVQPGDRFEIPTTVSISGQDGGFVVKSTTSGRLSIGELVISFEPGVSRLRL